MMLSDALLDQPHCRQDARGDGWLWRGAELRRFQPMPYSPKVPLAVLDPLVKSLSAVGCTSHCSCRGHVEDADGCSRQPLRIGLDDPLNAAWAQYLLEHARR